MNIRISSKITVFIVLGILAMVLAVGTAVAAPQSAKLGATSAAAVGNGFTYQGLLKQNNVPVSGTYDFQFKLYDASTGGNLISSAATTGTVTKEDVAISNGLFTTELNFGPAFATFKGDVRYLEIGVRPGSSTSAYTILSPRQAVTPVPYALNATNVGVLSAAEVEAAYTEVATIRGEVSGKVSKAGDTMTGNLSFGSATRQMLNLWGTAYGIGVQSLTTYFRSDSGFAWFNKGTHNDATNNAGTGGTLLMTLDSAGKLSPKSLGVSGNVAVGGNVEANGNLAAAGNVIANGNVTVGGNITSKNMPVIAYGQEQVASNITYPAIKNGSRAMDDVTITAPGPGFLFIIAFADVWMQGNGGLGDCCGEFKLDRVSVDGASAALLTNVRFYGGSEQTYNLSWVLPVDAAGPVRLRTTVNNDLSADQRTVDHNLTVLFIPARP